VNRSALRLLVLGLLLPFLDLSAQSSRRGCNGTPPDSAAQASNPYYLDCDVDSKASMKGREPNIQFAPSGAPRGRGDGCIYATFEFVVDTLGVPEYGSIKAVGTGDRDLEEAVRPTIPNLRYFPAKLKGQLVRQLVVYKRKVSFMTRVVVAPAGSAPLPPSGASMGRPPNC
jgi:hypothetical protein